MFVCSCSLHSECGLYQVVVGVEGGCCVGADVENGSFPALCGDEVVELYQVSIGSSVGVKLFWAFPHPCLWKAEVVGFASVEEH